MAGSSRRVRAQTGHRAIEGAQNQLKRRIGWPKETAPGLSWGAKVIDFNLPAATRSAPRESQRRAGASYRLLSLCFVFFNEKWSANFWLSPQMQPFQTKTLIFEVPGSNLDVILKRLNDFCDFVHQERMSPITPKINPLERPKLVQEGQTCGSAKAMQKL